MTVKELIEILQELPKEASVNFKVGGGERDADRHAKVQLRSGEALCLLSIKELVYDQHYWDEVPEDGWINIILHDRNYSSAGVMKYVDEFDDLVRGIKLREDL